MTAVIQGDEATIGVGGKRSYTRTIRVNTPAGSNAGQAAASAGVPRLYDTYPGDPQAIVKTKKSRPVDEADGRTAWDVTVDWDTEPIDPKDKEKDDEPDPLRRRPIPSWDATEDVEYLSKDLSTPPKKVCNTAGEPLKPGLDKPKSIAILRIVRNEATFDGAKYKEYVDTVNEEEFWGYAAGQALFKVPRGQERQEGELIYQEVNFEIHFREPDWHAHPLNKGFKYRPAAGEPAKSAQDLEHRQEPVEVLLAANGTKLPDDGTEHYLEFTRYASKSWTSLGLNR